jgi:hypothetical protein
MVVSGQAQLIRPHAEHNVLHHVDRALAPVDVHFATLLAPFRPRIVRHVSPYSPQPVVQSSRTVPSRISAACGLIDHAESTSKGKPVPGQIVVPASAISLQTGQLKRRIEGKRVGSMWQASDQPPSCSAANSVKNTGQNPYGTTGLYPPGPTSTGERIWKSKSAPG